MVRVMVAVVTADLRGGYRSWDENTLGATYLFAESLSAHHPVCTSTVEDYCTSLAEALQVGVAGAVRLFWGARVDVRPPEAGSLEWSDDCGGVMSASPRGGHYQTRTR